MILFTCQMLHLHIYRHRGSLKFSWLQLYSNSTHNKQQSYSEKYNFDILADICTLSSAKNDSLRLSYPSVCLSFCSSSLLSSSGAVTSTVSTTSARLLPPLRHCHAVPTFTSTVTPDATWRRHHHHHYITALHKNDSTHVVYFLTKSTHSKL